MSDVVGYDKIKQRYEIGGYVDAWESISTFYINYDIKNKIFGYWLNDELYDGFYTHNDNLSDKENVISEFLDFVEHFNNTFYQTKDDYKNNKSYKITELLSVIDDYQNIYEVFEKNTTNDIVLDVHYHYAKHDIEFAVDYCSIFVYSNDVEILSFSDEYHSGGRATLDGFIQGVEWYSGKKVIVNRTNFADDKIVVN